MRPILFFVISVFSGLLLLWRASGRFEPLSTLSRILNLIGGLWLLGIALAIWINFLGK